MTIRWLVLLCAWLPAIAAAHSASTAYLRITPDDRGAAIDWRIAVRDLDVVLDLDADGDGRLVWGEVVDRADAINVLARERLALEADGQACAIVFDAPTFVRLDGLGYVQLSGRADCVRRPAVLHYRLFEDIDPSHRALLVAAHEAAPRLVAPGQRLPLGASLVHRPRFADFVLQGITHIVGGFDHVLFLVGLLLPAVLRREAGQWVARDDVRGAAIAVVWIATAFTAAHSLTLAAATFGWVRIPTRIIEPLIAATVLATALNNLWPVVTRRLALVAFGFGLIHGFGFAEVLAPLQLAPLQLASALAGFNLGVEVGQLGIVAASFALLAVLRRWRGYARWVLTPGSIALALVALIWIVERVFDVSLLVV